MTLTTRRKAMSSETEQRDEQQAVKRGEPSQDEINADRESNAEFQGFALVEIIEIIHIVIAIVGGSFTAAAALMSLIGTGPEIVSVQAAIGGVGGFLLGMVVLLEFLLQRYG